MERYIFLSFKSFFKFYIKVEFNLKLRSCFHPCSSIFLCLSSFWKVSDGVEILKHNFIFQSIINSELSDNLKVSEFELTDEEMEKIHTLNKNMRKIVPIVKLKNGEIILRDGKSRHFPFTFEEALD